MSCSVLITATDISHDPSKLVFFNNYEDGELGKGKFVSNRNSWSSKLPYTVLLKCNVALT